jgi:predicted enzyme related to lactoylglutathione lyase
MNQHEKIDYLEFPSRDLEITKSFFIKVFNWSFTDYGPGYSSFEGAGIAGGFFKSDLQCSTETGSVLVVFYSEKLEDTLRKVQDAQGTMVRPTFEFPGGRRFHFADPNGNEYAVWSDRKEPNG